MFNFFHRTPEIFLDCFTADNTVYLTTPIVRASKALPEWWVKLKPGSPKFVHSEENPYHIKEDLTARNCYAIIELYKKGIIIENWADISFRMENNSYNYWYASGDPPQTHDKKQLGTSFPNYHHIKLSSPWMFRETKGVKFLWLGAEWSLDKLDIKILPGVINFDITSQVNVNMMFPVRDGTFTIPAGNPLVHLVPLSDHKLTVKNHLVTRQEFDKNVLNSRQITFYGWKKTLQLRKRNRERGTCPFHGDKNG
jgi:hypothetical protein